MGEMARGDCPIYYFFDYLFIADFATTPFLDRGLTSDEAAGPLRYFAEAFRHIQ